MLTSEVSANQRVDDGEAPSLDAVRLLLDRSLDAKWDAFRTDFRGLWVEFQQQCVESSHRLVVTEKTAADEWYAALATECLALQTKCTDQARYNQLLQEKLDRTEEGNAVAVGRVDDYPHI
jgi:hypothetical protein